VCDYQVLNPKFETVLAKSRLIRGLHKERPWLGI